MPRIALHLFTSYLALKLAIIVGHSRAIIAQQSAQFPPRFQQAFERLLLWRFQRTLALNLAAVEDSTISRPTRSSHCTSGTTAIILGTMTSRRRLSESAQTPNRCSSCVPLCGTRNARAQHQRGHGIHFLCLFALGAFMHRGTLLRNACLRALVVAPAASGSVTCPKHLAPNA